MKVVGSKPIFYAGYLTFASDIVKPNLRGQGTLLSETKGQVVRKTVVVVVVVVVVSQRFQILYNNPL